VFLVVQERERRKASDRSSKGVCVCEPKIKSKKSGKINFKVKFLLKLNSTQCCFKTINGDKKELFAIFSVLQITNLEENLLQLN